MLRRVCVFSPIAGRHYYAQSASSESTSDVSVHRYEERKRESQADWDRAFSFSLAPARYDTNMTYVRQTVNPATDFLLSV